MDFDLTDEQRLLRESVDRLIQDRYGFEAQRSYRAEPGGWSRTVWAQFAELGLLGLPFAEEDGGFGGGPVELALVMEAFGRGLVIEPYLATVVMSGALLRHLATPAQRARIVPGIAAGERILAYAQLERQSRYSLNDVATRAEPDGDSWRLSGAKSLVLHGESADTLLVTARTAGEHRDRHGIGLFLVEAEGEGVSRRFYPTQDGMGAAEIELRSARAEVVGAPGEALMGLEHAQDEILAALCSEAVGVMQVMHQMTVEYLKTRKQFGRAIGDNQSLQHRAVDMYVSLEQARSMSLFATMMASESDFVERQRAMHAAKVQIGRSGRHIGQEAVQLHGGIGVTMEYAVGHYFKRMTMIERAFGDTDLHLAALARLGGLIAA
ncbi:MAG: acyl-CoA dehydrogenase family protein [Acetobacteraceae bacterium]|nr:acyl-CoA dehydrogenase family protein [Acetobacteraceae bacterium]